MPSASTFEPIAHTTFGSSTTTVSFSNIPQTYTDLVLMVYAADTAGNYFSNIQIRFNGQTVGTNNSSSTLIGRSNTAIGFELNNRDGAWGGYISGVSGVFSQARVDIMSYSQSDTYKAVMYRSSLGVYDSVNQPVVEHGVNSCREQNAITSMVITVASTGLAGSQFTLYGIKAAS
jgi:hypothetical protein